MAGHSRRTIQKDILSKVREQGIYRRFVRMVIPVALVLVVAVYWGLHMNAVTMNSTELICATAEHTHTASCYAWVSASGSVLTEDGVSGLESIVDTEDTVGTEGVEATETTGVAGSAEAAEQTVTGVDGINAAEATGLAAAVESSESAAAAESTADAEATEDAVATESIEVTESTEESDTALYELPTDAQAGDTVMVDGVEYVYTLTCAQAEHTHTDTCYATVTGSETETDESADGNASADGDENASSDSSYAGNTASDGSSACDEDGGADTSEENAISTNAGIMLTSGADESDDSEESVTENTENTENTGNTISTENIESTESTDNTEDTGSTETSSNTLTATADSEESITYTASDVTYDESTGDFSMYLKVAFVFNEVDSNGDGSSYYVGSNYDADIINNSQYTTAYRIPLPEGVTVPSSLINGSSYNGYLEGATDTVVFKYYFESYTYKDSNDAVQTGYYIYIVFMNKDDLEKSGYEVDSTLEGYVEYSGSLSSDAYNADGDVIRIYDSFTEALAIEISGSQIQYDGNSTMTEDVSVMKSGSYDASSNTITYTITVYSKKGTGSTIELTDAFADSGFAKILQNEGSLISISCEKTTVTYTTYQNVDYGVTAASEGTVVSLNDGATDTTVPYYYTDEEGTIHIVLEGLEAYTDDTTAYAYVITYTYEVDPEYQTTYSSTNSVTASTDYSGTGYSGYISDTETATVYVTGTSVIKKTGTYDSSSGEITWTITVGDGSKSVEGFALTDDMITNLTADAITIIDTSGNETAVSPCYAAASTDGSGNVTYTYYSDAAMTTEITDTTEISSYAIVYVLDTSAASTGTSGTEYPVSSILFHSGTQYTITYTTSVDSVWTSQTVTNTAELTYEGSDEGQEGDSYSSSYSMYISGSGTNAFAKTFDSVVETTDSNGNTTSLTLNWTTTFTVPTTGIPSGMVFTDYVSDSSNSTSQYITYEQAGAIVTALNYAWGSGNISIEFCTNSNYYSTWTTDWVSADSLDTSGETVYYQFRVTVLNDIDYAEVQTITYTYSTTADVTGYDTNTYYNTLTDGSNSTGPSYTWYKKVAKYGTDTSGNISSGSETSITTSVDEDGNVTVAWIVRLVVDDSNTYTYTVTDTLPEGVTLSALQVSQYGNSNYKTISITGSDSTTVSGVGTFVYKAETAAGTSGDVQTVTLTVSDISSGVSTLYLKYTCTYQVGTESEGNSYSLGNSVAVTVKGTGNTETNYGDASQTTIVTIPTTTTSTEEVTKESVFDSNNNVLTYTVDINPDGETYTNSEGEAYADLTVTDTLTYSTYPDMGMLRSATLITSSLRLIDVDTGEELDSSEYTWTYSETSTLIEWAQATYGNAYTEAKIITLTVPNGRHLKLVYEYSFTIIQSGTWTEYDTRATNTAVLSAESETIYSTPGVTDYSNLSEVLTYGASTSGSVSYTIYKVDEDDFALTLSGATFTLYVYDSDSKNFIAAGDYTTGSNGSTSITGTPTFDSSGDIVSYTVKVPNQEAVEVPVDTICFFVETSAPENYKLDSTKYYFYYGSAVSQAASACDGYTSSAADAKNMVISGSIYITNEHSSDYYAAKTSISVLKTWFDANGEEYEKSDGSITFNLYRILKLNDGTITNTSLESGGTSGSTSGESSDGSAYLTWSLTYNDRNGGYATYEAGKTKVNDDGSAVITVTWSGNNEWWYTLLQLIQVTDSGKTLLATAGGGSSWSYTISDTNIVKSVEYTDGAYVFTLQGVTSSMEIMCYADYVYSNDLSSYVLDAEVTTSSDSGSSGSGSSGSSSGDGGTSSSDDTSGTVYRLNFSDLYEKSAFDDGSGNYGDLGILGKYGWTDDEKPDLTDDNYEYGSTGFFYIEGTGSNADSGQANLSVSHGTASYDINGNGEVDDGETGMEVCLKMENGVGTAIRFTSTGGGYLTMVFNSDGSGNSVKITKEGGSSEILSPSTSLYVIYEYLDAGTYTITYNQSCYLFYIAFNEGADYVEEDTDTSIHNFNNGTDSVYYTISGSLSYYYGTVSYDDIIASQCLKMNSSASITFTSEDAGTIYLIMTNPKGSSKVGVTLDGEEVYATATTTADSKGYRIYTIMQRVDAGTHTITRINGTEVMLYYIAYMADDYDGKTWAEDAESEALEGLKVEGEETETYAAYNSYKELVETVTISAGTDWSWYSASLPSEYVDTDTGEVLGEYYYFVVETKVNGEDVTDSSNSSYEIQYLNDDGISYGSIGIGNTLTETSDESTSVTLQKNWVNGNEDANGEVLSIGSAADASTTLNVSTATITYGLYAVMNLTDASALTEGDSYSRTFTTVESDTFYTVTGSRSNNGTKVATSVVYGDSSTDYGLKLDKSGTVSFEAPATDGILTLVFSAYNRTGSSGDAVLYGPYFTFTGPNEKAYVYFYSADDDSLTVTLNGVEVEDPYKTSVSYSESNNAVAITFQLQDAGEYIITRGESGESYLHYIDYAYQYCNLVDGVLIQSGTLSVDDTIMDSNSTTTTWAKEISGLPLNIYSEDGDNSVIGTYTYYVKETGISITVDGVTYDLEYDSDKESYSVSYMVNGIQYKYTVKPSIVLTKEGSSTTTTDSISSGSIAITNVLSLSTTEAGTILPATGGIGRDEFYAIVAMLMGLCATLLLTHLHQKSMQKRKGRQG